MNNDEMLMEIHGKVCAIDERTERQETTLDGHQEEISNLRERAASSETEIEVIKDTVADVAKKAGRKSGAGWGATAAVLISGLKELIGMRGA